MTIQFFHHGNTIGEVTLDLYATEDDARLFAATSMRLPIARVLNKAHDNGLATTLFNDEDEQRTVTAWVLVNAA